MSNNYKNKNHFILSHPSMNLIEITVSEEMEKQFPSFFAFIMFVPGIPDNSKQSGRSYDMSRKAFIKFSLEELFQLAHALQEAAQLGSSDYIKFADSSKAGKDKNIKKVTVSAVNNGGKVKVYLNYKDDRTDVATTFTKWSAIGFGKQIEAIASQAQVLDAQLKTELARRRYAQQQQQQVPQAQPVPQQGNNYYGG